MSLRHRIRAAIDGFKLLRREGDVIDAYVRPMDVAREGRYVKQPYAELTARYSISYVKVAVSRNATAVASVPLRVMRRRRSGSKWASAWDTKSLDRDALHGVRTLAGRYARKQASASDDVEEVVDPAHPLVKLLDQVNSHINAFDLIEQTQTFLGLIGNAYWAVVRGAGGVPEAIWPLQAQFVEALPDRQRFIGAYRFGRGYENERTFDADDVVHFRQFNPNDPYYGVGDSAAHVDSSDLSALFTKAAMAMLTNGVQPGLIAVMPGIDENKRQALEAAVNRKHSGATRWFRTWVLSSPLNSKVTFEQLDIGEGATKFLALPADKIREVIANCHDMPVALLTLDSAALATAKAAIPQWQRMAILPRCRRIEDQINQRLVPMFSGTTTGELFVAFDGAVTEDENERATRLSQLVAGRIITPNEARAQLGMEPMDGGDELQEQSPPQLEGDGFGEKPDSDGSKGLKLHKPASMREIWAAA